MNEKYAQEPLRVEEPVAKETTSIKSIYSQLEEINVILNSTEEKLDYAVNGNASCDGKSDKVAGGSITLDMIQNEIDSIRRRSNDISKLSNILLGT